MAKKRKPPPSLKMKPKGAELRRARLEELDRDQFSIFVYLAMPKERIIDLLKKLSVSLTGFRQEGLGDIERTDLVADEFAGYPEHRKLILQALERELEPLAEADETLGPAAQVLGPMFAMEGGTSRAVARLLMDPGEDVRRVGFDLLNSLADYYLGEPVAPAEGEEAQEPPRPGAPPPDPTEPLRREIQRLKERAEGAEREREARGEQLAQARREAAEAKAALGELRRTLATVQADRDRAKASLQEMLAGHSPTEQRLRKDVEELKQRIERLEEERRVLRIEETRLKTALARALAGEKAPEPPRPAPPPAAADEESPEEAPSTWLMPVFTKEFYDSLPKWERRIQRAAFQKALTLAQDYRHPSLRAIPLEGVPNLWRIRIATDVRLLYRRGEGNLIEILRLIDREDLDRWIKVEKLRS